MNLIIFKNRQKMMHLLFLCSLFLAITATNIDNQLPQLQHTSYNYKLPEHLNITLKQQFPIIIPQFDMRQIPKDLKIYQLTQQKFANLFQTMEKHDKAADDDKLIEVDNNIFDCSMKLPSMYVSRTLDTVSIKAAGYFNYQVQQSMVYVPLLSKSLLYTLDTSTMEISAYRFTDKSLKFLSSARIKANTRTQIKITMASSSDQNYIYIISSRGMWSIATNTVLTNVKYLKDSFGGFNSTNNLVDKLYHGFSGNLIGLSRNKAIYILPEHQYSQFITIDSYNGKKISPQDVSIEGRLIYVLDSQTGIYIYQLIGDGTIEQKDVISLRTYSNKQIVVKGDSIFVKYSDQQGQKIIQLNYDIQQKVAKLVRYYKSDQIITSISVIPALVSAQEEYSQSRVEPLLFLTADNGQIETFPYNIDPRTIMKIHNGPKMHIEGVNKIFHIQSNLFLLATPNQIMYVSIAIQKPELICKFPESTGHIYYLLEFSSNISTCEHYDHNIKQKKSYNSYCQLKQSITIFINDPQLSKLQKVMLYGVVLLVVGSFIIGVLCLIQWRDNKLSLIGRIKDQIIRFRDRHRKMQPFAEQQDNKSKQVQFEMPQPIKEYKDQDQ